MKSYIATGMLAGLVVSAACQPTCEPPSCVRFEGPGVLTPTGPAPATGDVNIGVLDTIWRIGSMHGGPQEEFGRVVGAAFDQLGRVYVLDALSRNVRVFDQGGGHVTTFGTEGRGPGEFASPEAIGHDGLETLYVLDARNGLALFRTSLEEPRYTHTLSLEGLSGSDFCFSNGMIYVFAQRAGNVLHEFSEDGRLLRSFGQLFGPGEHQVVQHAISDRGRVACVPSRDLIIAVARTSPEVRAHRITTGELVWSDSVPDFVPPMMQVYPLAQAPTGFAYSSMCAPGLGCASHHALHAVDEDYVWSQARRVPDRNNPQEVITSCLMHVETGKCSMSSGALPLLTTFGGQYAIAVQEELFPVVTLLTVAYLR